nr:MAG TPA_asm: hypothetical protein [Caudoviricetes sp.]
MMKRQTFIYTSFSYMSSYIKSPTSEHVCPKKDVGGLSLILLYYKDSIKLISNHVLSLCKNICSVMYYRPLYHITFPSLDGLQATFSPIS